MLLLTVLIVGYWLGTFVENHFTEVGWMGFFHLFTFLAAVALFGAWVYRWLAS